MSIFSGTKSCVFSSVQVQLLMNGQPVKHAKVLRKWNWNKNRADETLTDKNGIAKFPAIYESSASRLFPAEFVVGQGLSVIIDGDEKEFYTNGKRKTDENSEWGGADFVAICELSDEEVLIEDYGSLMVTTCKLEKKDV